MLNNKYKLNTKRKRKDAEKNEAIIGTTVQRNTGKDVESRHGKYWCV